MKAKGKGKGKRQKGRTPRDASLYSRSLKRRLSQHGHQHISPRRLRPGTRKASEATSSLRQSYSSGAASAACSRKVYLRYGR